MFFIVNNIYIFLNSMNEQPFKIQLRQIYFDIVLILMNKSFKIQHRLIDTDNILIFECS